MGAASRCSQAQRIFERAIIDRFAMSDDNPYPAADVLAEPKFSLRPVASTRGLPARADVVIIGGGIVGASAALFLARKGVSVALCEKGEIAGEQSSRNWGWCRNTL